MTQSFMSYRSLDWKTLLELAEKRLTLEVCMGGGKVIDSISHATHLVVLSLQGSSVDFDAALKR